MKNFTWELVNGCVSVEWDVYWGHSDFGRNVSWCLIFVPKRQGMISWWNSNVCSCCKFWIEVYLTETVVYIWVQLEIYIKAWNILSFNCWTPYCIIFIEIWGSDICLFKKKFLKNDNARYINSKSVFPFFPPNRWG